MLMTGAHIMDGGISMSHHEMPATECDSASCFMSAQAVLLMAVLFSDSTTREFITLVSFILCVFTASLFLPDQYSFRKSRGHPLFFLSAAFAVSTVIFRE